jgi:dihydroorotate dehydrogenase
VVAARSLGLSGPRFTRLHALPYLLARPLLFALDAERSHELSLAALEQAHRAGALRRFWPQLPDDPVHVMGIEFPNPIGLAAGLDKHGAHVDAFGDLGFGFIEAGTVTPLPQPGNPRPRLFRLAEHHALINRFGFNSVGLDAFVANLERQGEFTGRGGVLGVNIGKNASTAIDRSLEDYSAGLSRVYPLVAARGGYVTVNVSSPNTRNLRELQNESGLTALLAGLRSERKRLADRFGKRVPLAVKIAPDLDDDAIRVIADVLVAHDVDAVIATNTTVSRTDLGNNPHAGESGGLSGKPLHTKSTHVVATLAAHLRGALPIIGVGGVMRADDAVAKLRAGASLVQLYTGLIYRGPSLIHECRKAARVFRAQVPVDRA